MKAIVQHRYGPPDELRVEEVEKPVAGDGEVLLRVRAAGVNPLDWHFVRGMPRLIRLSMGMTAPKTTRRGVDVAGEIEAVGRGVKELQPGDDVFGWCDGAFAEYAVAPADHFVVKPSATSFEEAAGVPVAAVTALQALRDKGKLQPGQRVLVNGAAGGVGTFAVQIAKALGASSVTGVCSSRNVDLIRSLGADLVVDYAREDFTRRPERYDLVLDNAGNHAVSEVRNVLRPEGTLVYNSGASMRRVAWASVLSRAGQRVFMFLAQITHEDLLFIRGLIEAGKLRSVVDRTYPLAETGAAIAYVEAGHARGKVVVVTA